MNRCPICDTYLNASDLPQGELDKRLKSWPPETSAKYGLSEFGQSTLHSTEIAPMKTLRDEIAIEAMKCALYDNSMGHPCSDILKVISSSSYALADAMLKARDAKPECQHESEPNLEACIKTKFPDQSFHYRCRKCGEFFRYEHSSCKTHKPSIE